MPLIRLNNITLPLDAFTLRVDTLDLFAGEVHAIMGENGSGKSLLMDVICGKRQPKTGALVHDPSIEDNGYFGKNTADILYISQDLELLDTLSISENLFFHNMPKKRGLFGTIEFTKLDYAFKNLIDEFDLPFSLDDRVANLGMAQRQILEFCKAYISEAKVVILDEPSGALSTSERRLLFDIVHKITAKGTGVFYITHCLEDVFTIADRVSVIRKGSLVGTKKVSETSENEIIKMMSNNQLSPRYPKLTIHKGKTILSVKNLGFEDKLYNINFDLHEGEILGITGLAGSGRSLLANCLFGNVAYHGDIYINKHKTSILSPRVAIQNGIALVPENRKNDALFGTLNLDENVAFPSLKRFAKNTIINMAYLRESVMDYVVRVNIGKDKHMSLKALDNSAIQKALFAKWIMSRAKIFILDEPTRGVDLPSKIDIYNFINDLVKHQVAIIFISSDIEEIFGICDRVAVLSDNTLACDEATNQTTIERIIKLAAAK